MEQRPIDRRVLPTGVQISRWTSVDGWPHRRLDWFQPSGKDVRGSLLFAAGRGDFLEKYLEIYAWWQARGWNVTAFDWRGQGGSRGEIVGGHLESFDPLVDDLSALVREWTQAMPGPHVAIGHSMGGHLLLRTLAERSAALEEPIEAAVLVAPMLMINSAPLPPFAAAATARFLSLIGRSRRPAWQQARSRPGGGAFRRGNLTGDNDRYEDELWWWTQKPGFNLGAPTWGWLRAAYTSCSALADAKLRGVRTPLLLLGSERDRLVSPAAIRHAASILPNAELMMFDDSAHEILRERDEVRLRALTRIDAFFDRHAPR
jgi:lysophospholipase